MTKEPPTRYNLQVQINNSVTITSLKRNKGDSVAIFLAPLNATAAQIRKGLIDGIAEI